MSKRRGEVLAKTPQIHNTPATADAKRDFLWKIIARFDFYIGSTNTKAAFILAFCTVALGVVTANPEKLLGPFVSFPLLQQFIAASIFTLIGTLLFSLWFTLKVVNPFLSSPSEPGGYHSKVFFGDVGRFPSAEKYWASFSSLSAESIEEDLAKQAHVLALGTASKFKNLKRAIGFLLFGSLPTMIAYVVLRVVVAVIGSVNV